MLECSHREAEKTADQFVCVWNTGRQRKPGLECRRFETSVETDFHCTEYSIDFSLST